MRIDMNNVAVRSTQPLPLGVTRTSEGVRFSFAGYGAKKCTVCIYERDNEDSSIFIDLDDKYKNGTVFSCELVVIRNDSKRNKLVPAEILFKYLSNKCEYELKLDGNKWLDPYAFKLYGRNGFGKRTSRIRCGFDLVEYSWKSDRKINRAISENIIYELHLRGFTKHKSSGVHHRGTYAGLMEKIPYIMDLGMNAVLLLPTYEFNEIMISDIPLGMPDGFVDDEYSDNPVKINYWGYTTDCFYFTPKSSYASKPENCTTEFRDMVKQLHENNIEIFMDMHFPVKCDQALILDCLRHWILEYHVDGFRINLNAVSEQLIRNDSIVGGVKLIASGWEHDSNRISQTPYPLNLYKKSGSVNQLAVCNDSFMTTLRKYLKGEENQLSDFAGLFQRRTAGFSFINYVTEVNGFTLRDCVSYEQKHNRDNGENNADGTDYNYSWNCGAEGATKRRAVIALRNTQIKNALTLLFLSRGIPLLLAGDEFGNTQKGNNNAYCQDNDISWLNWKPAGANHDNISFVKSLVSIRQELINYSDISFHGLQAWSPDYHPYSRTIGIMLHNNNAFENGEMGNNIEKSGLYIAINMHSFEHIFELPRIMDGKRWMLLYSTDNTQVDYNSHSYENECDKIENIMKYNIQPNTIAVFIRSTRIDKLNDSYKNKLK